MKSIILLSLLTSLTTLEQIASANSQNPGEEKNTRELCASLSVYPKTVMRSGDDDMKHCYDFPQCGLTKPKKDAKGMVVSYGECIPKEECAKSECFDY